MNILHICVTSNGFNIDNKIVDHRLDLPFVAITRAKPIRFNVIHLHCYIFNFAFCKGHLSFIYLFVNDGACIYIWRN